MFSNVTTLPDILINDFKPIINIKLNITNLLILSAYKRFAYFVFIFLPRLLLINLDTFLHLMLVYAMFFSDAIKSSVVLKYFRTKSVMGMQFSHMSLYISSNVLRFSFAFWSSFAPNLLQILSIILYLNIWFMQSSAYSSGFLVLVRSSIGGSCLTSPAPMIILSGC